MHNPSSEPVYGVCRVNVSTQAGVATITLEMDNVSYISERFFMKCLAQAYSIVAAVSVADRDADNLTEIPDAILKEFQDGQED